MIGPEEIVIASNESTKDIHRNLFHLPEECYIVIDSNTLESITSLFKGAERVHLALNWPDIIRFCTWQERPDRGAFFLILRRLGISNEDLRPFKDSPVTDIFPYLYYSKRFDILRRICSETKKNTERNIKDRNVRVNCHLIYEEAATIVASSL